MPLSFGYHSNHAYLTIDEWNKLMWSHILSAFTFENILLHRRLTFSSGGAYDQILCISLIQNFLNMYRSRDFHSFFWIQLYSAFLLTKFSHLLPWALKQLIVFDLNDSSILHIEWIFANFLNAIQTFCIFLMSSSTITCKLCTVSLNSCNTQKNFFGMNIFNINLGASNFNTHVWLKLFLVSMNQVEY